MADDFIADYLALREANERLRIAGREWIWTNLTGFADAVNQVTGGVTGDDPDLVKPLQIGRQEWQFQVEQSTMVGERLGLRYNARTLLFEIGWPRLPEHGIVPDNGLARGRVSFSQNVMLDPRPITELILRRDPAGAAPNWHLITHKKLGERVTELHLREFLRLIID